MHFTNFILFSRKKFVLNATARMGSDGLNSIRYSVTDTKYKPLFTHLFVLYSDKQNNKNNNNKS